MNDKTESVLLQSIPDAETIRLRLRTVVQEVDVLRRLLRVAERADRVRACKTIAPRPPQEGNQ